MLRFSLWGWEVCLFRWRVSPGLPRFLRAPQQAQAAPVCHCDMFPEPHPAGYAAGGVVCELALPGVRISPHLANLLSQMWADAAVIAADAPALSAEQLTSLQRLTRAHASARAE